MKAKFIIIISVLLAVVVIIFLFKKKEHIKEIPKDKLFYLIPPDSSNIHFTNTITTNDTLNFFRFEYMYNGGGVGIGDFNNDGLQDIFFTGNQVPSKIYINKGNFRFEDITAGSGIVIDNGFAFGVSVVDVNQDGLADIYVSVGGPQRKDIYPNKLFINKGVDKNKNPHFTEMANEYGLADSGQSIQAVFFDYDHDGDLDMYQLTGGGFEKSPNVASPIVKDGSAKNTDRLYRNDADNKLGHPVFTNVSKQAGIVEEGFGLGVSLIDINEDGWQDIYITNDYISSDLLYINNKDGTFSEKVKVYFKHTSLFAMGNDIGDINNDGLVDILSVDMLPDDHYQKMLMYGPSQYDKFYYSVGLGYAYQYMRNTLQLNRGSGKFSEIGQLAGIYKSSWSWAPLFADLDNDGYQDIFITNGFPKNITDLDFVKYRSDAKKSVDPNKQFTILLDSLSARPGIKTHTYSYKNNGDYTFSDSSIQWGFDKPNYSNGAAYVDLDNDGDLDLVTNSIDEPANIYRNTTIEKNKTAANYLRIKLKGAINNIDAFSSKIDIKYKGQTQTRSLNTVRGFESSVEPVAHFGLGTQGMVDTIIVSWPDGKRSVVTSVKTNQVVTINYYAGSLAINEKNTSVVAPIFSEINQASLNIHYKNKYVEFNDFNYERLIPRKYSQNGPPIAVGDINGDGLEDFFVGGMYLQTGKIYLQNKNGLFTEDSLSTVKQFSQDAGCLLFDADGDGDADLYVVSGGSEFDTNNAAYQDRLYLNDGKGKFTLNEKALPIMRSSKSCVIGADYDGDGDIDLFVGGGNVPGFYPQGPESYILQNKKGIFTDVTAMVTPELKNIGMVTSANWTDIDNDGKPDLIIVGEWIPITIFKNNGNKFNNITNSSGLQNTEGWWQSIVSGDFDNDGDMDYVIGNWGTNTPYTASVKEPLNVSYKDFDGNGSVDPIICYYQEGVNYPAASWDFLTEQVPSARKFFPSYASYAAASKEKLLSKMNVAGMQNLYCKTLHSVYLQNNNNGKFSIKKLPIEAQFSPIFGMLACDVNHDGNLDLIAAGNFYGTEVVTGRYDASTGLVLQGDGKGNFISLNITQTGFIVDGDAKALSRIEMANKSSLLLVTQNSDVIKFFKETTAVFSRSVIPTQQEFYAMINFKNGSKQKRELSFGSSYLSQSSRNIIVTGDIKSVTFYTAIGVKTRTFEFK